MVKTVALLVFIFGAVPGLHAQERTWRDASGKFSIDAEFVELADGVVRLKRTNGKTISLPLSRLCEADRRWVLAKDQAETPGAEAPTTPMAGSQYEPADAPDSAIEKHWVAPFKDRLTFVMPWDSKRPERARICPAGETRQIWLDVNGHRLQAGKQTLILDVVAKRLNDGPAPSRHEMLTRLQALAAEAPSRSYWYPWKECKPEKEACPHGASFVNAVRKSGRRTELPEYVLWTPSAWIGVPPCSLPPTLDSEARVATAFCLDEWEPVCLTVTNLGEVDLEFDISVSPDGTDKPEAEDSLVRRVELELEIWPLRLPPTARMAAFTFNYGMGDAEHVAFLKRMKCNWFSLANPKFTVSGDEIECDLSYTDRSLQAVRPHGKGLFVYSLLMDFVNGLEKDAGIKPSDDRFEPLLRSYLTQFLRHMRAEQWKPEDYAVQLWDEPGLKNRDDPDEVFPLIKRAARIMREIEPDVQIMVNPLLKPKQLNYYAMIDEETAIWCPHQGAVYTLTDARPLRWDRARSLDPSRQGNLVLQGYLKTSREQGGSQLWTYFNRDFPYSPIVYYRHMPWKNKWMEFDGVSFFGSWYVTGGVLKNPNHRGTPQWWRYSLKDMYGWREGIEDIQYLELAAAAAGTRGSRSRRAMTVYDRALKRVIGQGWWAKDPLLLEEAITTSRRELAEVVIQERDREK